MNEKTLIKRIKQIKEQIVLLEEANMDDVTRKEHIERNEHLSKMYLRKLKDLKWNWLLRGGDINELINNESRRNTIKSGLDTSNSR